MKLALIHPWQEGRLAFCFWDFRFFVEYHKEEMAIGLVVNVLDFGFILIVHL